MIKEKSNQEKGGEFNTNIIIIPVFLIPMIMIPYLFHLHNPIHIGIDHGDVTLPRFSIKVGDSLLKYRALPNSWMVFVNGKIPI